MSAKTQKQASLNAQFMNPKAQQLRYLVLDYLSHNCYTRTAKAFARDSIVRHLDADGDEVPRPEGEGDSFGITDDELKQIELRRDVQTSILSGRVDDATNALNTHFPAVLSEGHATPERPKSSLSSHDIIDSIIPLSVEPAHLFLNLRILAFVEAARTIPLEYTPGPAATAPAAEASADTALSDISNGIANIREPDLIPDSDAHLERLFHHACELYDCSQLLKDPADRAAYHKELGSISSLLAYKVPEKSPMASYLSQSRREQVADEVNSAILYRAGLSPISYLELYVRYTGVLWQYLNDLRVKMPPAASMPPGVRLPVRRPITANASVPPTKAQTTDKDNSEVVPLFDLKSFLSS
ncbi:hypothetical protein EVG20_g349 [Dentipellis fragilis]|uniref:CRA domain-containing protein n=1 Tax=Dentipellis fragilis TaxID=205917 RepID=A0A4Y9ZDZ8_9AGAM|nr:hypothetical protein EVG20_g349 [Dentipellis fragilis]